jgi:hypothetical protein
MVAWWKKWMEIEGQEPLDETTIRSMMQMLFLFLIADDLESIRRLDTFIPFRDEMWENLRKYSGHMR